MPEVGARNRWVQVLVPTLTDFLFISFFMWIFATGAGWMTLLADGDTGFHIRTGDYILQTGTVPKTDIFSFSKAGEPWFAWEWLSAVVFSKLHAAAGLKALVFFCGVLITASVVLLFRLMLWRGSQLFPALFLTLLASGAAWIHFLARPHLFTLLLLPVALWWLERERRECSAALWWLIPIFIVWTNLHGGFLVAIACTGIYAVGSLIEGLWANGFVLRQALREDGPDRRFYQARRFLLLAAGLSVAAMVNPYGWRLYAHLAGFFATGEWWQKAIQEFEPTKVGDPQMRQFEILLLLGVGWLASLIRRRRVVEALLIVFFAQQALGSVRHVSLYAWVAAPILAEEISALWETWTAHRPRKSVMGILRDLNREFTYKPLAPTVWSLAVLLFIWVSPAQSWPTDFPDVKYPLAMIKKHENRFVRPGGAEVRLLTSDEYGDYFIYRFYPKMKVFLDGRGDFYGPAFQRDAARLLAGKHPWRDLLRKYKFNLALIPVDWNLAETLKLDPGWRVVEDNGMAVLFEERRP